MKFSKLFLVALGSVSLLVSCSKEDAIPATAATYNNGIFVVNEGSSGQGSVSFIGNDFSNFAQDVYGAVNGSDLMGKYAESMFFDGDYAYIIANGSNKINVVNRITFKLAAKIETGLNNPRFGVVKDGIAYVTNWGDGSNPDDDYVAVINLATNTISNTIPVAEGPEKIIENAGTLYVAHYGGWSIGNSVSVIDTATNTVTTRITVGVSPNSMQINNGSLWVSCGGYPSYVFAPLTETAGELVKIDLVTNQVTAELPYTDTTKHITNLVIVGSDAYYTIDSGVYKCSLSSNALPENPIFTTGYSIYSFAINNSYIYAGDPGDYTANGKVHIYSSSPATIGALEKTYTVGVVPTGFYFNN